MLSGISRKELEMELEKRRHNLSVVQELIDQNPQTGSKLVEVRDFLLHRIKAIEQELRRRSELVVTA